MAKSKKKRKNKNNKNNRKSKSENKKVYSKFFVYLSIVIFLLLIFLSFNLDKKKEHSELAEVRVANLRFEESEKNEFLFFDVINEESNEVKCLAAFSYNDELIEWDLGNLNAKTVKTFRKAILMPNGETKFRLETKCRKIDLSAFDEGLDESGILVNELSEIKPYIRQCVNRSADERYFCVAILEDDVNYCGNIKEAYREILCKAHVLKEPGLCAELDDDNRDKCYQDYAVNKRDKATCEKIKSKDKRNSCLGVAFMNVDYCKDINEEDKFFCVINLAEFTRNKELCELVSEKEDCYEELNWMN